MGLISLNYRDARPIYEQVKDGLRRLIVSGALRPDEKLPSVRALATQLAINPNTIQRAYLELESEGYIYSVAGRGSFVEERTAADKARRAQLSEQFRALAQELTALGATRESLIALLPPAGDAGDDKKEETT